MGRKRTSNKENVIVSVDKDIMEKLRKYEVNRSQMFTKAALKEISKIEENIEDIVK